MPLIQGSLEGFQPLIEVVVGRTGHDGSSYRALIDTGATSCCISRAILDRHALDYRTKLLIQTAGSHPRRERAYAFTLALPCRTTVNGPKTLFLWPGELVAPAILDAPGYDLLLGLDLLSRGRLLFDHGDFSLEFSSAF